MEQGVTILEEHRCRSAVEIFRRVSNVYTRMDYGFQIEIYSKIRLDRRPIQRYSSSHLLLAIVNLIPLIQDSSLPSYNPTAN